MKILPHVGFWLGVVTLLTVIFGRSYQSYIESFYFVCMLLPISIGTTYMFNYVLVPRYLLRKRYFKFSLYCLYLLIISLNLEMYVITGAFIILAEYNYANMNPVTTDVFVLTLSLYFVVFGAAFVRLVKYYYKDQKSLFEVSNELEKTKVRYLTIKENRKNSRVAIDSINYVESLSDYVKIHTNLTPPIITKEKISKMADKLPAEFIRCHRSYLINKRKVLSFKSDTIKIDDKELPIGRSYKESTLAKLKE